MIFIGYSKCSTCKKTKKFLDNKKISYTYRDIKNENPTEEELKNYINKSGKEINKFFNTSGIKYRENNLKDKIKSMTDDEKIALLSTDGMLVKRPILVTDNKVYVGFNETEWNEISERN